MQLSCLLVDTCIRLRHNVQIKMEEKSNPIFFIDGFVHSATNKTLKFSSRIQFKNISFQFEEKMIHQIYKTIQTDVIRGNDKVKIEYLHMVGLKKFDKSCWEHILHKQCTY